MTIPEPHKLYVTIPELHKLYVHLTGLEIRLDMDRERVWFEWQRKKFTADDLRLVIAHIRRGIREGKRNPGALKFRNLIGCPDFFEEDLAEARCKLRASNARPTEARASALRATGRDPSESPNPNLTPNLNPHRADQVSEKALAELRQFREGNK